MSHGQVTTLCLQLAVMLGAGVLLGQIARRLHMPALFGELIAGVLLGPTLLGAVAPGTWSALFPHEGPVPIASGAIVNLGMLLFLFTAGLEVNADPVALKARNRLAILETGGGSLAFFPPSHKFFFAREIETNLGFVYYRKTSETSFAVGVRQADREEPYKPFGVSDQDWEKRAREARHDINNFALYNAPPFRFSRTPVELRAPAPLLGEHTREVCVGLLGISETEVDELIAQGVLK